MTSNIIILLSGAPGTGKSTIQRLAPAFFRERLGESAAFGTDEIYQMIDPDWAHTGERLGRICKRNCNALALNLFRNDISVVLIAGNALYDEHEVHDYVAALAPVSSVYHFTLIAPVDALDERVRARGDGDEHPREWLAAWLDLVQRHAGPWTHVIDTSACAPGDVLEIILSTVQQNRERSERSQRSNR